MAANSVLLTRAIVTLAESGTRLRDDGIPATSVGLEMAAWRVYHGHFALGTFEEILALQEQYVGGYVRPRDFLTKIIYSHPTVGAVGISRRAMKVWKGQSTVCRELTPELEDQHAEQFDIQIRWLVQDWHERRPEPEPEIEARPDVENVFDGEMTPELEEHLRFEAEMNEPGFLESYGLTP